METEQLFQLTQEDIENIKKLIEKEDVMGDKEMEIITNSRNNIFRSTIHRAKFIIRIYNALQITSNYIPNKEIKTILKNYLVNLKLDKIGILIENYNNGESVGDYYKEQKIIEEVNEKKERCDEMVAIFFKIYGESSSF